MGMIYDGPYAEDVNRDGMHEGYVGRVLPDRSVTASWDLNDWTDHIGLVGACSCGWQSPYVRPPGEDDSPDYEAALRDFEHGHLDPLIDEARAASWPRWVHTVTAYANRVADLTAQGRYDEASSQLHALATEVTRRDGVIAQIRAEEPYRAARALSSPVLVFAPLDRPARSTRPAPPPPTPPGPGPDAGQGRRR